MYFDIRNKVYITFHGWETKLPIPNNAKIHRLLVSKLVRGSIHVGKFIQNFYWDKPNDVIYGGINQKRFTKSNLFEQTNDSAELRFVFVGRLDDDTDINMYINFLKILKLIINNIVFFYIFLNREFRNHETLLR